MVFSGAGVKVGYNWESSFKSAVSTVDKIFGLDQKISTFSTTNNSNKIKSVGNLEATATVFGLFSVSLSAEATLTNGWWLKALTGNNATTTGSSAPYTHTYLDTAGGVNLSSSVPSMGVYVEYPTFKELISGVVLKSISLSASVGDSVKITYDMEGSLIDTSATVSISAPTETEVLTFAHGTLEIPSGTTITKVDNLTLNINRNAELIGGVGSRTYQDSYMKTYDYDISFTIPYEDTTHLQRVLGGSSTSTNPSETATLKLVFNNGKTGSSLRELYLEFANISYDEIARSLDPENPVMQDISVRPRTWSKAYWKDNNSTAL